MTGVVLITRGDSGVALVVDADHAVLRGCAALLHAAGLQVRTATSGDAAVDALADGEVEVVVANLRLPDATGPELLGAIRARDGEVPVIFVTGWPDFASEGDTLRGTVVTAAIGCRLGRHARRIMRMP